MPILVIDRLRRKKINKDREESNNIIGKKDINDIYKTWLPATSSKKSSRICICYKHKGKENTFINTMFLYVVRFISASCILFHRFVYSVPVLHYFNYTDFVVLF